MITLLGPTTQVSTGAYTHAIPSGTVANDLLLLAVETEASNVMATPTGWTAMPPVVNATFTRLSVFWKVAVASEPGAPIADAGDHMVSQMWSLRGVDFTGPVGWFDTATPAAASATINWPNLSSSSINSGDFVMFLAASHADSSGIPINDYSLTNVEHFLNGSYHWNGGAGGGIVHVGGRTIDASGVDASATMAGSIYQALMSISFIAAPDNDARVYDDQISTVVVHEDAANTFNFGQQLTTVALHEDAANTFNFGQQIITVVTLEQAKKSNNFMNFNPT